MVLTGHCRPDMFCSPAVARLRLAACLASRAALVVSFVMSSLLAYRAVSFRWAGAKMQDCRMKEGYKRVGADE